MSLLAAFTQQLRPALVGLVVLTLLTGVVFPAVVFGLGRLLFPAQADGSLLTRGGVVVGSRLIGQAFARPEYFQPRGSAAGNGYDASQSGGTNLSPSNPKQIDAVRQAAQAYRKLNGLAPDAVIPVDAATSSASGLDPHISPQNAALQAPRVARARGVGEDVVRRLVADHTQGRQLGFMGAPRVSVLELNLALDQTAPVPHR
ncbi:MAG: K(+)-transporting ATPase subunit C [Caulobacterales bacterium]